MIDIVMPRQGLAMDEGAVVEWYFAVGERVEGQQAVVVVEGEKTTYEIESPGTGILGEVLVAEEETVPVGSILGRIYSDQAWELHRKEGK